MRRIPIGLLALAGLCGLTAALQAEEPPKIPAAIALETPWGLATLTRIQKHAGDPPRFDAVVKVHLPNPGWTVKVGKVHPADDEGRIRVDLVEAAPEDTTKGWPSVIVQKDVVVPLGTRPAGQYLLEVWGLRKGREAQRRGAFVLSALGPPR